MTMMLGSLPRYAVALAGATMLSCASGLEAGAPRCGDQVCSAGEETSCPADCAGCGDGVARDGESCDGGDLGGETCASLGLDAGSLGCGDDCRFDTSGCALSSCGDGVRDSGEQCDGGDLGGETCASAGLGAGELACGTDCAYDFSGCCNDVCAAEGETSWPCPTTWRPRQS